jgi:hypothetical protein
LEGEDFYAWLVKTRHAILRDKPRMTFTDQDSPLAHPIVRLPVDHPEIAHRRYLFHERRNVQARVHPVTRDAHVSTKEGKEFNEFMDGKTEDIAEQTVAIIVRYFCDNIGPQIVEQRPSDARQNRGGKLVVRMGNATLDRAKLTESCFKTLRLRDADHPPYSPDLAPSDFYLFGQ